MKISQGEEACVEEARREPGGPLVLSPSVQDPPCSHHQCVTTHTQHHQPGSSPIPRCPLLLGLHWVDLTDWLDGWLAGWLAGWLVG